jgi:hypothetical protein
MSKVLAFSALTIGLLALAGCGGSALSEGSGLLAPLGVALAALGSRFRR